MIPRSLAEVDESFLTELMQSACPGVAVTGFAIEGEVHGTATKAKLRLSYAAGPAGPTTLYIKGGWEEGSEILRQVGIYCREPRAYAELLPRLGVTAPRCYGAIWDEATLEGVLLLEDLDAAGAAIRSPESLVGADEAHDLLLGLARMHAATAGSRLPRGAWIRPLFKDSERPGSYLRHILEERQLTSYLSLPRGAAIPGQLRDPGVIRRAFDRTLAWGLGERSAVLLHGDAHVGNSYVDAAGQPALLDWQCVSTGGWAFDVAYYLSSALTVEDRRAHERDLLAAYAACLAASGGPVLTADAALRSYAAYLSYGFLVWLANSTSFQPERFNALVASRFAEAMLDHGVAG